MTRHLQWTAGVLLVCSALLTAPGWPQPASKEAWVMLAPMLQPQAELAAVALDGRVYVMGGWGSGGSDSPFTVVQIYDVARNQWSDGTPLTQAVHHAGAAVVGGKIYLIGGYHNTFRQRSPTNTVQVFDPATKMWSVARRCRRRGERSQSRRSVL